MKNVTNNRVVALACVVFLVLVLAACSSGGDSSATPPPPVDRCDSTSVLEDGVCRTFARRLDLMAATPFVDDGTAVDLEIVVFKPLSGERFPAVVFHHGSTGNGSACSTSPHRA